MKKIRVYVIVRGEGPIPAEQHHDTICATAGKAKAVAIMERIIVREMGATPVPFRIASGILGRFSPGEGFCVREQAEVSVSEVDDD